MTKSKENRLIIELKTDQPEILKSDIQKGVKYSIKVSQVLIDLFPTLALLESQSALQQILKGLKEKD